MSDGSHAVFTEANPAVFAPPSAASASTYAASARDMRQVLVKFRVDVAFKGKEVLRPITYFPIYTEVLVDNDANFTVPDVPAAPPHFRHLQTGVKRNDWTRGNCAMIERRYSEVHDLRELLTFQFPTLIIPPLPTKSSVKDIETYFNAEDTLQAQRYNVQFFLKEIAAMPELIFFSEWVPPFFLEPRDSFETGTLLRLRDALTQYRAANKFVYMLSKRHGSMTTDAANMIAAKSTQLVRSVAGWIWGGNSTANDEATAAANTDTNRSSEIPEVFDWSGLPPVMAANAAAWVKESEKLQQRQKAMKRASRAFERFLSAMNTENTEQLKVAQAIEGYETTLRETEGFAKLSESYHLAVLQLDEVSNKEREYSEGKYLNVCLRLAFEGHFINAVLDAIDHLLCLYKSLCTNQYSMHDRTQQEEVAYAEAVSTGLRNDYVHRYQAYYTRRMRNLVREQIVGPSVEMVSVVNASVSGSALTHLIRDGSFVSYAAEQPAPQ